MVTQTGILSQFDLTGKKAIVTGARTGLGYGIAQALCEAGATVLLIDIQQEVENAARELGAKSLCADLSRLDELDGVFQEAVSHLGGLDILVNNAGTLKRCRSEDTGFSDWQRVLTLNLDATFRLCQLAGKLMLGQGSGKIINLASMLSYFGGYTVASYAASKGAVAQLTKALSNEWVGRGVHVNAIAPGYMDTSINTGLVKDPVRSREILGRIPKGRWGAPEDLKGATVFLASQASDYISGAILPVDGGFLAR